MQHKTIVHIEVKTALSKTNTRTHNNNNNNHKSCSDIFYTHFPSSIRKTLDRSIDRVVVVSRVWTFLANIIITITTRTCIPLLCNRTQPIYDFLYQTHSLAYHLHTKTTTSPLTIINDVPKGAMKITGHIPPTFFLLLYHNRHQIFSPWASTGDR